MLTGRDLWWSVIHLHVWSRNSACKANRGSTYEAQELPTWVFILCMLICSIQRNRSLLLGKPQPRNGVQCLSLVNALLDSQEDSHQHLRTTGPLWLWGSEQHWGREGLWFQLGQCQSLSSCSHCTWERATGPPVFSCAANSRENTPEGHLYLLHLLGLVRGCWGGALDGCSAVWPHTSSCCSVWVLFQTFVHQITFSKKTVCCTWPCGGARGCLLTLRLFKLVKTFAHKWNRSKIAALGRFTSGAMLGKDNSARISC